jgi:hypothetical protein
MRFDVIGKYGVEHRDLFDCGWVLAFCLDAFSSREPVPTPLSKCGRVFARNRSKDVSRRR